MTIDIICLAAMAYGFFVGYKEGILNSIFRVVSILVALMVAFRFSPAMTEMIEKGFNIYNPLMFIIGFVVTFFLTLWVFRWIGNLITAGMEVIHVNLINQAAGGIVVGMVFIVIYSIVLWFADSAGVIPAETKMQSRTFTYLEPLPQKTFAVLGDLKPTFSRFFNKTNEVMDDMERSRVKQKETKSDIYEVPENNNGNNGNANPPQ
jgi:membrane protein required for colicin V production